MSETPKTEQRAFQFSPRTLLVVVLIAALWLPWRGNPIVLLPLCYVAFVGYLLFSAKRLPDRVASHFNFRGQADNWMSRSAYLTLMALLGFVLPLVFLGLPFLSREIDPYFARHLVWFGCLGLGLLFGAHALVVQANRREPAKLSRMIWALLGLFLAGTILWQVVLVYRL